MEDNVHVYLRIRPPNTKELDFGYRKCISLLDNKNITIFTKPDSKNYTYDYIADINSTQDDIFNIVGKNICDTCLNDGQTGSGKTFTVSGPSLENGDEVFFDKNRGLLPRSLDYIFTKISKKTASSTIEYTCKASYMEIYNERAYDLLDPDQQNLNIREDSKLGVYLENLKEVNVTSSIEALRVAVVGSKNRRVASTAMNRESSRSHSLFCLTVTSKETKDGITRHKSSRFHMCDLAGSERQNSTQSSGSTLVEAGAINKSLSILGNVIMALVDIANGKSRHVHYRDSKLTFLLKDSLGGNSMTNIIANISPAEASLQETLSTLKFAARAKFIKNTAIVNEDTSGSVSVLLEEIKRLKEQLRNGVGIPQSISEPTIQQTITFEDQATTILHVPNYMSLQRYSQKQMQLFQEIGRLKEQSCSFTELIVAYEQEVQNQKMLARIRNKELDNLRKSLGHITDEEREKALIAKIDALHAEVDMFKRNNDLSPSAISWCLRFNLLEDKIQKEAPWVLSNTHPYEDITLPLQRAVEEANNKNEQLMRDLTELLNNYESLRKEQESGYIQNPDALWSKLPSSFKLSIPEIRDAAAAKTSNLKKIETLKFEKEIMSRKVNDLELKRVELEKLETEYEELKVAHSREITSVQRQAQEKIHAAVTKAVSDCTDKYNAELAGGTSQIQSVQIELIGLQSKLSGVESALKHSAEETLASELNRATLENNIQNLRARINSQEQEMLAMIEKSSEVAEEENKKREELLKEIDNAAKSNAVLNNTLIESNKQNAELNLKILEYESRLQTAVVSEADLKLKLEKVLKAKNELSNEYESKLFDFESLQQDNETLSDTNRTLIEQVSEINSAHKAEILSHEADVKKLNSVIDTLDSQLSELNQTIQSNKSSENEQIIWLTSERENLVSEVSNLKVENSKLEDKLSNNNSGINNLQDLLKEQKIKESSLIEANESFTSRISGLQKKITDLEDDIQIKMEESEKAKLSTASLENEVLEKDRLYSELLEEFKSASSNLVALRNESESKILELTEHYSKTSRLLDEANFNLNQSKSEIAKSTANHERDSKSIQQKFDHKMEDMNLKMKLMEYELQAAETKVADLHSELDEIRNAAVGTQTELLESSRKRENDLRTQIDDLQAMLSTLTKQYTQQELSLGRLSERTKKTSADYDTNLAEKTELINTLSSKLSSLENNSDTSEQKLNALQSLYDSLVKEYKFKETELQKELKAEREISSSADTQIQYLESKARNYEYQLKGYEDTMNTRLSQKTDLADRLQRFVLLEQAMYAEKEARDDENQKLSEKMRALETEIARMHGNLDAAVEEKFKLAQSKNHLQRIHLLDDTKKKLDSTMNDLNAERSRVKQLQTRLRKNSRATEEDLENDAAWLEVEVRHQRRMERCLVSLHRILSNQPPIPENLEIRAEDVTEKLVTECLTEVAALKSQHKVLSEKVMDESRKAVISEVLTLFEETKKDASELKGNINSINASVSKHK